MRVIAGSARRLKLKTLEGLETRPTQDIIKETLFNVIQNEVPGSRFLDLFSGSGAIGIEALSRGAREAVFVENNRKAVRIIDENLKFTGLSEGARVMAADCMVSLNRLENTGPFDIIHMDPPYEKDFEKSVMYYLKDSLLCAGDTLIIIEASVKTDPSFAVDLGYDIIKEKLYKHNKHIFLKRMRREA